MANVVVTMDEQDRDAAKTFLTRHGVGITEARTMNAILQALERAVPVPAVPVPAVPVPAVPEAVLPPE